MLLIRLLLERHTLWIQIETLNAKYLDVDKPRTTKTIENQNIVYNTGPTLKINRVFRSPTVGFGTYVVSLRDQRVGSNQQTPWK